MKLNKNKKELRSELKSAILNSKNTYQSDEAVINSIIFKFIESQKVKSVGVYISTKLEVSLTGFIKNLWQKKYIVSAPKVTGNNLEYFRINKFSDLTPGKFNIDEPKKNCPAVDTKDIDILILPGRAFDKVGTRLGSGRGFFDRFLTNFTSITIGVCASGQFVDNLPKESHDRQVLYVATEKGIWDTDKRKYIKIGSGL